jgi:hypothetical protein
LEASQNFSDFANLGTGNHLPGKKSTKCAGNQQKWDTFVKERSGGDGGVLGLPEQAVVAFALG